MALIQVNFPQGSNINQIMRIKQKSRFVLFFNSTLYSNNMQVHVQHTMRT